MAKAQPIWGGAKVRQKACVFAAGLALLFILPLLPAGLSIASPDEVRWSRVTIPTEGEAGDWLLADGSNIQHLTIAADGTLYAYAEGLTYTLFKSTDGGYSWSHTGNVQDNIVAIAIHPGDASFVYYATSSNVYRSSDGGKTFITLPPSPGGAGSNNVAITCLDVTQADGNIIAVGTRDTDNAQFGGVYTLNEAPFISTWADTGLTGYDVYAVAFSPDFAADRELTAVVTDETDTLVTTKIGSAGWGATISNARLDKDNSGTPTPVVVTTSAAIAFLDSNHASGNPQNNVLFVAIDTGTGDGDVYKINSATSSVSSAATDLNIGYTYGLSNIDVTGLAVHGDAATASLLAGAASSAQTYFSADGGTTWTMSLKEPTGASKTYVLMTSDFNSSGKAYATTSGSESAFSISQDNATTWNQVGLIDTDISTIVDLAPSPGYGEDGTLFMLTFGSEHSLWRSLDDGNAWERLFSSNLTNVDSLAMVELPPQYGNGSQVVFLTGSSYGRPAIWQSTDGGQTFIYRFTSNPTTGAQFSIDTWTVVSDTTLFLGSFDGSNGLVYQTTNGGVTYSTGVIAGSQSIHSIVLSPDFEEDNSILLGNTNGCVYWSDNGAFQPLPPDATSPPLSGQITVAFDPDFNNNRTVYAASDSADQGVYRFIIDTSTDWESIDGTLPSGGMLNQVIVSPDGTLYTANSKDDGGMERCFNPTFSLGPSFETVTRGLSDGATLFGLWQCGDRLWSVDTTNIRLMTFSDSLNSPVILNSPADAASGTGTLLNHTINNVSLDWKTLKGATSYQWQLDHDTDFSTVPSGFEGNTRASTAKLPALESATTYYWRVRATAPVLSMWSAKWSFTTSLDSEAIDIKLESPEAGASNTPLRPVFQWSAVAGADAYELLVSRDVDFANPSIAKISDYALPSTAWQCDVSLGHATTYYWKIRAVSASTHSAWSSVGAFTTEPPPQITPPEEEAPPTEPLPPLTAPMPLPTYQTSMPVIPPTPAPPPQAAPPPPATHHTRLDDIPHRWLAAADDTDAGYHAGAGARHKTPLERSG